MIFTMFEYLIIYMWTKRYVMEILWQLRDLSIYSGPEMIYSNAVGVMNIKWQSESDKNFSNFLTDQKNQSYLHFFKFI